MTLWYWITLSIILMGLEIFIGDMTFIALAIGSLGAILAAAVGLPMAIQFLSLGVCSLLSLFLLKPLLQDKFVPHDVHMGIDAYAGRPARVIEEIKPNERGKVTINGEIWYAEANTVIPEGSKVIITAVEGSTLHVVGKDELFSLDDTGTMIRPSVAEAKLEEQEEAEKKQNQMREGES